MNFKYIIINGVIFSLTLIVCSCYTKENKEELPEKLKAALMRPFETTRLELIDENIKELSDDICKLKKLKKLSILRVPIKKLPDCICEMKSLTKLSIERTELNNLPNCIGNLKQLEELYIMDSNIKTLPKSFWELKNLKEFGFTKELLPFLNNLPKDKYDWINRRLPSSPPETNGPICP